MHNVLIVDFTPYKATVETLFSSAGYATRTCESAYDAMALLKAEDFDLIVTEVELPGDNAFDLYNYISTYYPYIPTIMTTEKNIDTLFDRIFAEGIGNVLHKPLKGDEVIKLAAKLITKKNIFGIANYLKPAGGEVKKIRITASSQIQKAIDLVIEQITAWGFSVSNRAVLTLILNEMAINAVYHSHGFTHEKEKRVPVTLGENDFVEIYFAHDDARYGISINDYKGVLSKQRILDSINRAIEQNNLILRAAESGEDISALVAETGRGIDLVRKLLAEYYFVIRKGVRTEIILLFDREFSRADDSGSSLKIIEDLT